MDMKRVLSWRMLAIAPAIFCAPAWPAVGLARDFVERLKHKKELQPAELRLGRMQVHSEADELRPSENIATSTVNRSQAPSCRCRARYCGGGKPPPAGAAEDRRDAVETPRSSANSLMRLTYTCVHPC